MILKALYDYYHRCGDLPAYGLEEKEIGFLLVLSKDGKFLRFEDCRTEKNHARTYLVKKHVGRTSSAVANYLYDSGDYVFGYSMKDNGNDEAHFNIFKEKIFAIQKQFPDNEDMRALSLFYSNDRDTILSALQQDALWEDISKNLTKKYSIFSFRIDGDTKIVAEKWELLNVSDGDGQTNDSGCVCLVTGQQSTPVEITTNTMIPGSQAVAKLVSFQVNSGYDSYGKQKCFNAPISQEAEFAYTTALKTLLQHDSHNKFTLGTRTFLFWASSNSEAAQKAEESIFDMLGRSNEEQDDDPNAKVEQVRRVFTAIYGGNLHTTLDDRFYILGLAPNSARIAVVHWAEMSLKDFAGMILRHFDDMEIIDTRKDKKPYKGVYNILSAVTLGGKSSEATPNLPEALVQSVFQGLPYPFTLFSACIRRIRAEQTIPTVRAAILKSYLNRISNNQIITVMLDKENTNQGYLCGRLFAVLVKIQEDANKINTIAERYMNAAGTTPAAVFSTILNLSSHHAEKLNEGSKVFYEKIKQEIMGKLSADGFPTHLDLQDQGRFFVGYYHQRQEFFVGKENKVNE